MANQKTDKLASLARDAAEDSGEGKGFMNPKKSRGRPKGSTNKKEEQTSDQGPTPGPTVSSGPTPEMLIEANKKALKPVFEMVSQLGVKMAEDERAAMTGEQLEIIVESAAMCVNQYLPQALSNHGALILFSVTFGNWGVKVYLLRQAKLAELRALKRQQEQAGNRDAIVTEAVKV